MLGPATLSLVRLKDRKKIHLHLPITKSTLGVFKNRPVVRINEYDLLLSLSYKLYFRQEEPGPVVKIENVNTLSEDISR